MPDDDYFDDEAAQFGDPVHPDDRLWRHPSEIHKVPPPGARSIPDTVDFAPVPSRRSAWRMIAASSLVGAAVAVSVIMITGMGERVVERWNEPIGRVGFFASAPTLPTSTVAPDPDPEPTFSELAEANAPSLVWITVVNGERSSDCAGVVVRSDGHLLTDSQPFEEFSSITVRFHDGTIEPGQLVGIDPLTELAVVRVDRSDLVAATLGDPRSLKAGGLVMLLAPDETGQTAATVAMVNAVGTPARLGEQSTLYDMIQFDSPVPTDMSGGPLLNDEGHVVGITVRAGNGSPYGLATPIDSAATIADDLITAGYARHPWLGIEGRQESGLPMVVAVFDGSPAHIAGLQPNDIIVAIDGHPVPSMAAFVTRVRSHRPGDEITIRYLRAGFELDSLVVLGEHRHLPPPEEDSAAP